MSYDMLSSKKQKLNTEREKLTPPYSMCPIVRKLVRSVSGGCGRNGGHVSFDGLQEVVHEMLQRSYRRATLKQL